MGGQVASKSQRLKLRNKRHADEKFSRREIDHLREEFNPEIEKIMNIPYLIIVCTVLLVSGAISVGSTDIIGKAGEKTSINATRKGIGPQMDHETPHRQVRTNPTVNNDPSNQEESENSQTPLEFADKERSAQSRRLHAGRTQLAIFSLCLFSMKPLGHA